MLHEITVKVNGQALSESQADDILELVVDTDYFLPTMCCLTLRDSYDDPSDTLNYVDKDTFKIGKTLEISVKCEDNAFGGDNTISGDLFKGEITSIEPCFTKVSDVHLQVRAYDRAHRLTRGKKSIAFGDAKSPSISDSDIVSNIASKAGLSVDAARTSIKYPYILQHEQTDWDFLWERARLIGFQLYVDDRKLYFKKASDTRGSNAKELVWGRNLTSFEPCVTVMGQVSGFDVVGWDSLKKEAIIGSAKKATVSNAPQSGFNKQGGDMLKEAFGEVKDASSMGPLIAADQAKTMAEADFSAAESNFIRAEGVCEIMDPNLVAGRKVKISNVGKKFSGTYYVTQARHTWNKGDYNIHFSVSGSAPSGIYHLLNPDRTQAQDVVNGLVIGVVTNLQDPEKLGRVRVKFPWLPKMSGADLESNWARLAVPSGGKERGFYFSPEIDDEVLVAFDHGDINFPYIVGALWSKIDKPPAGTADAVGGDRKVNQRIIRSRSGHLIILDDKGGEEKIIIQDKTGKNSFVIDSKENSMKIAVEKDLLIETGGKFTVNSKGDIAMDSKTSGKIITQNAFNIEAKMEATLKAGQNQLALKPAGVELSGMKVDIKSNSMASINANAILEIKGALVKIN